MQSGDFRGCRLFFVLANRDRIISEAIDPKSFSYVSKSQQTEGYELLLLLAIDASRGTATAIPPPP